MWSIYPVNGNCSALKVKLERKNWIHTNWIHLTTVHNLRQTIYSTTFSFEKTYSLVFLNFLFTCVSILLILYKHIYIYKYKHKYKNCAIPFRHQIPAGSYEIASLIHFDLAEFIHETT